ncbi:hypothetical protein M413DRAFT_444696 [Hebeloma cylindrosporum]|uniref:Uncharacterized protein n=1 Tax=Hebeloma cylindrosporum TaxID=76867 RepID=A0A0C2YMM6_HEBCY|nr:hypothetical protein M413DRAFT_444696 [Hebeloma cylindrosporum h7]
MIVTENGEIPSSKSDDALESATVPDSGPTAPPSYVARNTYVPVNDKTPAFGDESGHPASSSASPSSFYASAPLSAIAGPSNSGRSQQDSDVASSPFSRVPPRELSYGSFQPMYLLCQGKTLDKGFPRAPPPSSMQPHPFNTHDIAEGDWLSFIEEVYSATTLTEKDVRRSYLPIISIIPIISPLSAAGVQKIMKNRKVHKVAKLIDTWNHHFFEPRKMRVVLMKGENKLSGLTPEPPLAPPPPPANLSEARTLVKNPDSEPGSSKKNDENYRLFVVSL